MDSKHKLLKQNFKAELMDLKQENETLRQQISALSSKLGKIDAIESRQKQMLAKQKNDAEIRASASKENVEPTPLSKSTVSPAQPNTSTAKPATEPHVAKPVPQGSTPVSAANLASSHEKTDSSTTKQLQEALNMAAGTVKDNIHTPPPHPKPFNIRLPPSGKIASLLIGDSNLQRVDQRRLDPSTCDIQWDSVV
nr:hypothetical protein BaRGS_017284 [Batillaria attramentaria]KAG5699130.1 hypothetical protein BaRGS_014429 [Batillaria attramentaria]